MRGFTSQIRVMLLAAGLLVVLITGIISAPVHGQASTDSGAVDSIDHPESVDSATEFNITVETSDSAATVVEVGTDESAVELSSEDAVKITDNRAEFVDIDADDSNYTVTVDLQDDIASETAEITAWVNAEYPSDADDITHSSVEVDAGTDTPSPADSYFEVSLTEHPSEATAGESFTVIYSVTNTAETAGNQQVSFAVNNETHIITDTHLDAGETEEVEYTYHPVDEDRPNTTLSVESQNATDTADIDIYTPADLTIVETDFGSAEHATGEELTIEATVENSGDLNATQDVEWIIDGWVIASESVGIAGGETATVEFSEEIDLASDEYVQKLQTANDSAQQGLEVTESDDSLPGFGIGGAVVGLVLTSGVLMRIRQT